MCSCYSEQKYKISIRESIFDQRGEKMTKLYIWVKNQFEYRLNCVNIIWFFTMWFYCITHTDDKANCGFTHTYKRKEQTSNHKIIILLREGKTSCHPLIEKVKLFFGRNFLLRNNLTLRTENIFNKHFHETWQLKLYEMYTRKVYRVDTKTRFKFFQEVV